MFSSSAIALLFLTVVGSTGAADTFQKPSLIPATNVNLPYFTGGFQSSAGRGGAIVTDALDKKWASYVVQPIVPKSSYCNYTYTQSLTGKTAWGKTFPTSGSKLNLDMVRQGGIGNCDFGAVMAALLNSTKYGTRMTNLLVTPKGAPTTRTFYDVNLLDLRGGKNVTINIDDQLPKAAGNGAPTQCYEWASFQGVNLANVTPVTSQISATDKKLTFFVPIIEKAVIKWLDLFPNWKTYNVTGYGGMESIAHWPLMMTLAGTTDVNVPFVQTAPGVLDKQYASDLKVAVLNMTTPTVIGTRGIWQMQQFPGYNATTNTAKIGSLLFSACVDGFSWRVGNACIANNHAFAVMRGTGDSKTITLRNPWDFSPQLNAQGNELFYGSAFVKLNATDFDMLPYITSSAAYLNS